MKIKLTPFAVALVVLSGQPLRAGSLSITNWENQPSSVNLVSTTTYTNAGAQGEWNNLMLSNLNEGDRRTTLSFFDLDPGQAISGFTATIGMELYHDWGANGRADGFSFYFGPQPTEHLGEDPSSTNALVGRLITYPYGSHPGYSLGANGTDAYNTEGDGAHGIPNGWMTLGITWNGLTLRLTESFDNNTKDVGSISTTGFTALPGYVFAIGHRTGGSAESAKVASLNITTTPVPEPGAAFLFSLLAGSMSFRRRRI